MLIARISATIASCTLAVLSASITQAQERSEPPLAFSILSTALDETGYEVMQLNMTNASSYSVKAYVLRMDLLNGSGKLIGTTNRAEVGPIAGPIEKRSWSPGESWKMEWRIPFKGLHPPSSYRLSLDYVLFVQDSQARTTGADQDWGIDKSGMSKQLIGMLDGAKAERARLRQISDSGGLDRLQADLASDGSPPKMVPEESDAHRVGVLGGYSGERARLRQLLKQQGASALVQDLNSDN